MTHFREEQQFRQPWLWILLLAPVVAGAAFAVHRVLSPGEGTADDRAVGLALPLMALLPAWFYAVKLVTEVTDEELIVRFRLLWPERRFPLRGIRSAKAIDYRPVRDYGGWGVRWGFRGRAYNVSGNRGVELELDDGSRVLIGSQRPEELANAIAARKSLLRG
jgi:hypothetical protein